MRTRTLLLPGPEIVPAPVAPAAHVALVPGGVAVGRMRRRRVQGQRVGAREGLAARGADGGRVVEFSVGGERGGGGAHEGAALLRAADVAGGVRPLVEPPGGGVS